MKLTKYKSAIILPLKESYTNKGFGAVSIWVKDFIQNSKMNNDVIFCKKIINQKYYLTKSVYPIKVVKKFFTNSNYIKKINKELVKKEFQIVEIHNRPEYAIYLIKNNPNLKVNLIFHNDPNTIRYSNSKKYKKFLLENCNKIIFVSRWVKKRFFFDLNYNHKNNVSIVYNFIKPIKKFPVKSKTIIFSGKLNKSKGFHIFGKTIVKILNKYKDWNAVVYGNEQREKFEFIHPNLKINNWISHKKLLKHFEKSSISVVNPTWDEPFGRTALESASRGCAVITSKSGGLSETFNNNLILKKNNEKELFNLLVNLIEDRSSLLKIQKKNFKNLIHYPEKSISKLNSFRINFHNKISKKKNTFKIIHISNFGLKSNFRLFNLSISKKISNGLIRNGHDVVNFDYRNHNVNFFEPNSLDNKILSICDNYKPDLVLFGHNNCLKKETLLYIRDKYKSKIALWYEDHVIKGDPSYKKNLDLIEANHNLIDQYFITTSPEIIKCKIPKYKINYLPIPVDPNIENGHFYEINKTKDLFFALSHGVNYGKLKKNTNDVRSNFINSLIHTSKDKVDFNLYGLFNEQPIWNYNFIKELMVTKTALNLSRGGPNKYASSNRIASIMGNGILPFIHEDIKYQDFFDNDEIINYKSSTDLVDKLLSIKDNKNQLLRRSIKSKKSYFNYFQNNIVADFLIYKIFKNKKSFDYVWYK